MFFAFCSFVPGLEREVSASSSFMLIYPFKPRGAKRARDPSDCIIMGGGSEMMGW